MLKHVRNDVSTLFQRQFGAHEKRERQCDNCGPHGSGSLYQLSSRAVPLRMNNPCRSLFQCYGEVRLEQIHQASFDFASHAVSLRPFVAAYTVRPTFPPSSHLDDTHAAESPIFVSAKLRGIQHWEGLEDLYATQQPQRTHAHLRTLLAVPMIP